MRRVLFMVAVFCGALKAQPLAPARVVSVTDGDTLKVNTNGVIQKIRLDGIDAPESRQAGGAGSRQALDRLLPEGSSVQLLTLGQDRYGRILAQLYLPDGTSVNVEQVRSGQAWVFTRYCRDPQYWNPLEEEARRKHRGLWFQPEPVAPWDFRHPRSGR